MKTRTFLSISIFVLVVAVIFIFSSCDDNGGAESYFIYDGTTYPLATAVILEIIPAGDLYNIHFWACSSDIDLEAMTGIGEAIWIVLYSPNSTIAEGTYTFKSLNGAEAYTVVVLRIMIDFNIETDEGELYMTDSGIVTVTKSDGTYTIEFDVTLENGKTAT